MSLLLACGLAGAARSEEEVAAQQRLDVANGNKRSTCARFESHGSQEQ